MPHESDWLDQDEAARQTYDYYMRMDPNQREFLGPIELKYDEIFGREVKQRLAKIGMVRGAKSENMVETTVFLEPFPHARMSHARPLQGWYSGKSDGDDWRQRDRPCLLPGSLVQTPFGDVPIQELKPGDVVFGCDVDRRLVRQTVVTAVWSPGTKPGYVEIVLESGRTLRLTPEHEVFTVNRGWVDAGTLTTADDLLPITIKHDRGVAPGLCGVYALRNTDTGKVYVGSSTNCVARIKRHIYRLKAGCHVNKHLQAAFDLGASFDCSVLETCCADDLVAREQHFIDAARSCDSHFGYNLTEAGRTVLSADERKRLGLLRRGRKIEEIYKDPSKAAARRAALRAQTGAANPNFGNRGDRHPNFGKTNVARFGEEEACRLASITSRAHKGKSVSPETRAKLSLARKGKSLSAEHKAAISIGLKKRPYRGPWSAEVAGKIKETLKRRYAAGELPVSEAQRLARRRNALALHGRVQ